MRQEVAAAHKKFLSWKKDECISGRVRLLLIYIEVIRRYKHLLWARPRWLRESKFFPAEKPDILMKALEHLEKEAEDAGELLELAEGDDDMVADLEASLKRAADRAALPRL